MQNPEVSGKMFAGNQKFQRNIYLKPEDSHCDLGDFTL